MKTMLWEKTKQTAVHKISNITDGDATTSNFVRREDKQRTAGGG